MSTKPPVWAPPGALISTLDLNDSGEPIKVPLIREDGALFVDGEYVQATPLPPERDDFQWYGPIGVSACDAQSREMAPSGYDRAGGAGIGYFIYLDIKGSGELTNHRWTSRFHWASIGPNGPGLYWAATAEKMYYLGEFSEEAGIAEEYLPDYSALIQRWPSYTFEIEGEGMIEVTTSAVEVELRRIIGTAKYGPFTAKYKNLEEPRRFDIWRYLQVGGSASAAGTEVALKLNGQGEITDFRQVDPPGLTPEEEKILRKAWVEFAVAAMANVFANEIQEVSLDDIAEGQDR